MCSMRLLYAFQMLVIAGLLSALLPAKPKGRAKIKIAKFRWLLEYVVVSSMEEIYQIIIGDTRLKQIDTS